MLAVVREHAQDERRVLVIGHNPGMQELLYLLTGCVEDMPTAAIAVVELPIGEWTDASDRTIGKLVKICRPKDLER
jgi:phosphohistidine phosphatase